MLNRDTIRFELFSRWNKNRPTFSSFLLNIFPHLLVFGWSKICEQSSLSLFLTPFPLCVRLTLSLILRVFVLHYFFVWSKPVNDPSSRIVLSWSLWFLFQCMFFLFFYCPLLFWLSFIPSRARHIPAYLGHTQHTKTIHLSFGRVSSYCFSLTPSLVCCPSIFV